MSNILSRRNLFKIIVNKYSSGFDSLLEKYRRKIYNGRRYVDPTASSNNLNRKAAVTTGIAKYNGVWTEKEVVYLLKRTLFGFKIKDVNTFVSIGMNETINQLLNFNNVAPSPPVNNYQNVFKDEGGIAYGSDWTNHAFSTNSIGGSTDNYRHLSLASWNTGHALNQENNIREKMLWFWYHFIPIDTNTVRAASGSNSARICYDYFKFLRTNAT